MKRTLFLLLLLSAGCMQSGAVQDAGVNALREALTFHASFDGGVDADFALGDARMYTAPSMRERAGATAGLDAGDLIVPAEGQGMFGDALYFAQRQTPLVFYRAAENMRYDAQDWSGTVSFWLSLDPDEDLEPGYADPIMITPNRWNDAAFFVEFGRDETPRHFRLGVFADLDVWNADGREMDDISLQERPLVHVTEPHFRRDKWTHVVFTFERFNTGESNGTARLYLDGERKGVLPEQIQTFTWDPADTVIALGLSYIGLFDELSIFNRSLTDEEVRVLHGMEHGVRSLVDPDA